MGFWEGQRERETERSRVAKFSMGSKGGYIQGTYRSQEARARREVPLRYRDITAREELPARRQQRAHDDTLDAMMHGHSIGLPKLPLPRRW